MIKRISLRTFAVTLLVFTEAACLSQAQQSTSQPLNAMAATVSTPKIYIDEGGLDLLNPPFLCKYAHGFKHIDGNGIRNRMPSPPTQPQARELYGQSQDFRDVGFAYLMYGHPEKAIDHLKQSLSLWPASDATYRWLAEAYTATGQTKEAIANYRLLFYGWPGKYVPADDDKTKPKETPSDKPSDYDQPNPEEADPTLLMRFSLLLQQTNQYAEAQTVYERGMQAMADKFGATGNPLPPLSASSLTTPASLEAAARTALAIDQMSYQDKPEAEDNLKQAHLLQPQLSMKAYRRAKSTKLAKSIK